LNQGKAHIPEGWRVLPLGEVCELVIGRTPSRKRDDYWRAGVFPWVTIGDMTSPVVTETKERISECAVEETKIPLVPKGTVLLSFKLSLGKVAIAGTDLHTNEAIMAITPKDDRVVHNEYLYYAVKSLDLQRHARQAVKGKTVNKEILQGMNLLVPPLPVQERIVQILQKTNEVHRKCNYAVDLAEAILAASFMSMFGTYFGSASQSERIALGQLANVKSGVTKGRKLKQAQTVTVPYLRVANVQDGFLDLLDVRDIEVLPADVEKYELRDGDILMTEGGDPDKLGRGAIWRGQVESCIHQNHVFRVRTDRARLAPEYLAALLRTHYAKQYFLSCAKRSSNLASVNSTQVKAFPVPLPPLRMQEKFVSAVEQWLQSSERLTEGVKNADELLSSMMNQAFSGQLTASWEESHASAIAEQVKLHQRLPRMVVLGLLYDKSERAPGPVPITALMKYVFMLQMEANGTRRFYHFVPYYYGPFAKQLYADLEELVAEGVIRVENDREEDQTRITLTNGAKAADILATMPPDLAMDVRATIETYGGMSHKALLKEVYRKYPAYTRKSKISKTVAK
jgi:type I restriction enzyme S subunit